MSTSPAASSTGGASNPASVLFAGLRAAAPTVVSAHVLLETDTNGQVSTWSGDETFAGGEVKAAEMTHTSGGQTTFFVFYGRKVYVKVPASSAPIGKQYRLASPKSTDAATRQFATMVAEELASGSPNALADYAAAASSVAAHAPSTVNGAHVLATPYEMYVDTSKIPASWPRTQVMRQYGVKDVPLIISVDARGRAVDVEIQYHSTGITAGDYLAMTKFNAPVTIAPPAQSLVFTSP